MIWTITDASGASFGPFSTLGTAEAYIKSALNHTCRAGGSFMIEPLAMVQSKNGDTRPVYQVLAEAYTAAAAAIITKGAADEQRPDTAR